MAFFGLTYMGYQDPFRSRSLSQTQRTRSGQGGESLSEGSRLPPIQTEAKPPTSSLETHRGSQQRHQDMVRLARTPQSPNQMYRTPLTNGQCYGWWLQGSGQTGIADTEPWTQVQRFPRKDSEMTRFVKEMSMTNRQFSLY
ncbi:sperm microtubule inner protein 11 [Amia ocellicauda]|uniref:sperm microtubule inner protein 11 n=1 Tax=Amia ocellicauda TaxID=2972642 RepID=UPI003463D212